ncbi:Fringe-like family protein [Aphelenchoides avenae]|nr:Fringe-like family protein [Aphelenchus avenae]
MRLLSSSAIVLLFYVAYEVASANSISFIVLSQPFPYDAQRAQSLKQKIEAAGASLNVSVSIKLLHADFPSVIGSWAVWPLLARLSEDILRSEWIIFCEPHTHFDLAGISTFLQQHAPSDSVVIGRALRDKKPVIIHHYHIDRDDPMLYPDFASGVIMSRNLGTRLIRALKESEPNINFVIDPKFELAKLIYEKTQTRLIDVSPGLCLLKSEVASGKCMAWYEEPSFSETEDECGAGVTNEDVFFAVKTFSGNHKSRVVYVKRTWAKDVKYVEYFSDIDDIYVPTINVGIPNTERGHCAKTLAIIKHFLEQQELEHVQWLAIADDDTLLGVTNLRQMLNCLPSSKKLIVGERYGYGFTSDGKGGYDYPTGGAGMVFTRAAAAALASLCECPQTDAPDDMIIGMCARRLGIPIIHSAAFHQAQPYDYAETYLNRIRPISFHKFHDLDPYKVYTDYLDANVRPSHSEL